MDIHQLKCFLEIARQGSFSKASHKLHLSQPTLSKMIKSIEEELGVVLFDRSTRRVQLTDVGELVSKHAKLVLSSMDNMYTELNDLMQFKRGTVKLGLPPVIGATFFPPMVSRFTAVYPEIITQFVEEGSREIERLLLEGDIHLGVVVFPVEEENLFNSVPIVERRLNLIVHPSHRLVQYKDVTISDLKEEAFILFRKGFTLHDQVRDACNHKGFEPRIAYESSQWDFISEAVAANLGISFLPESITKKLSPEQVTVIDINNPHIHWNLMLIWSKQHYVPIAARTWIEFIQNEFQIKK